MAIIEQQTDPKDDIVASRDSEVWRQVGMLEEEIGRICNTINELCDSLIEYVSWVKARLGV
ncbi:MAG: hypothetical protein P8012_00105 [Desulfobacterales bacterium]